MPWHGLGGVCRQPSVLIRHHRIRCITPREVRVIKRYLRLEVVFGRLYSPILALRLSGEQSRGDPVHGIRCTFQKSGKVGIVVELILSLYFQRQQIEILSDLIQTQHVCHPCPIIPRIQTVIYSGFPLHAFFSYIL